jgi:hypothetical protein
MAGAGRKRWLTEVKTGLRACGTDLAVDTHALNVSLQVYKHEQVPSLLHLYLLLGVDMISEKRLSNILVIDYPFRSLIH